MTAPDMVSIIAEVLLNHPVTRTGHCECGARVHWATPENVAAHQARAVLDAISEAGQVEWAIFRKIADENALPFDWSAGKTYGQSMSRIERMYPRDRDQLQPRSRITGPWTAVE